MKLVTIFRSATVGIVALLSAGCVDTGYRDGYYDGYPRVYRDDYDRGYRRADYLRSDRRYYRRHDRYDRYHSRDRRSFRSGGDRLGIAGYRDGRVYRIGPANPRGGGGPRPRILFRSPN